MKRTLCIIFVFFLICYNKNVFGAGVIDIIRTEKMDYGGVQVITRQDPDCPVYFSAHLLKANFADLSIHEPRLNDEGMKLVDQVLVGRVAAKAAAAKEAAIDQMLTAELAKRKSAALAAKSDATPAEVLAAVFAAEVKP